MRCSRQLLELVRGPVAEIERPRRSELERIAARRDVPQVQRRATADHLLHRGPVAVDQRGRMRFEEIEEAASRMSAALTASVIRRASRDRPSVARKLKSLITANGGANVPR